MRLGMGIDTGGTCTDAVLYDFGTERVVASAKAVTTREDLTKGILDAIDRLPAALLPHIRRVALSTTLATNACVENKGGRAKLLVLNAYPSVVEDAGHRYGLPPSKEMLLADMPVEAGDSQWDALFRAGSDWMRDADAFGIVELDADRNGAAIEKAAAACLRAKTHKPVIGGHELFHEPNVLQRGAGTLLNARLVPVINGFLAAVRNAMTKRGIHAPVVIVRSDGTLMSEAFTGVRPVETLLCGPAASVVGGMRLAGVRDCLIVDMGGTTTDLAIVRDGHPLRAQDGVRIGAWKTYVHGVYIDTFGLGGDSAIRHTQHGAPHLDSARVMPLCMAAEQWPCIVDRLTELLARRHRHTHPLHEGFVLLKALAEIESDAFRYTEIEKRICRALAQGPMLLEDLARAIGTDVYNFGTGCLEREGVLLRIGLTPTDLMHVLGEFTRYDSRASVLGLRFVAACCDMSPEALATHVYDLIGRKLYVHLVRLLLETSDPWYRKHGLGNGLERLIESTWDAARNRQDENDDSDEGRTSPVDRLTEWKKARGKQADSIGLTRLLQVDLRVPAALVGIGAPTHLFLPEVARVLGAVCILPEHAQVANAVGAIVSQVSAEAVVSVRLEGGPGGFSGFRVNGFGGSRLFESKEEAAAHAAHEAAAEARAEARRRGAEGELAVTVDISAEVAQARGGTPIELGFSVTATAVGRPAPA